VLFYAALPLALFVRRWRVAVLAVLTAVLFVIGIKYHAGGPETDTARKLFGIFLYAFMPGVLLAALEPHVRSWLPAHRRVAGTLTWALLAYFVLAVVIRIYGEPPPATMHALVASGPVALLTAALLRQWAHGTNWKLIDGRVVHWLGERSYGLYLWHLFVAVEVVNLAGEGTPGLPAYFGLGFLILAISLVFAELSYRYIEMPFLRRKVPWRRDTLPHPAVAR
jgi:peptidoglycan/LPS O-acetylase OafA/YrhL